MKANGLSVSTAGGLVSAYLGRSHLYEIHDDSKLMLDILRSEKILMVRGTGFNWSDPDHFRVVTLPWASQLENAIERLGNFLVSYKQ
ncbi:aminotransferase AlaT [Corynebacterium halotolerans YIM 70093 = DSM 44683]|uniref:alanine transaminase n=1 Tax=Corynebacterium halotolerans YIM 70093 = DSM 44683 TaxID=1121362 RepID=M1NVS1_9CORY|nr:aminotransferase AlaT [Corynebacterium halotolerans YIM 70093 = DSM 44683]